MPGLVLTELEIIGKARNDVVQAADHGGTCSAATPDVVEAFARLQRAARQGGFHFAPCCKHIKDRDVADTVALPPVIRTAQF